MFCFLSGVVFFFLNNGLLGYVDAALWLAWKLLPKEEKGLGEMM